MRHGGYVSTVFQRPDSLMSKLNANRPPSPSTLCKVLTYMVMFGLTLFGRGGGGGGNLPAAEFFNIARKPLSLGSFVT